MGSEANDDHTTPLEQYPWRSGLTFFDNHDNSAFREMLKTAPDVGDPKVVPCARRKLKGRRRVAEAARLLLGPGGTLYVIRYRYFFRRRRGTLFDYEGEYQEFAVAYEGDSPEEAAEEMNMSLAELDGSGFNALSLESLGGGHVKPRPVNCPYSAEEIALGVAALA